MSPYAAHRSTKSRIAAEYVMDAMDQGADLEDAAIAAARLFDVTLPEIRGRLNSMTDR